MNQTLFNYKADNSVIIQLKSVSVNSV